MPQWTRVELEGCGRDKLRSRALDLRAAIGQTESAAPLPSTADTLIEWILAQQGATAVYAHTHERPLSTSMRRCTHARTCTQQAGAHGCAHARTMASIHQARGLDPQPILPSQTVSAILSAMPWAKD